MSSTNEQWWATKTAQHGASAYLPVSQPVWVDLQKTLPSRHHPDPTPHRTVWDLTGRTRGLAHRTAPQLL